MKVYKRKCKNCKKSFEPKRANQIVCCYECAIGFQKKQKANRWKKEKRQLKESLKTHKDWLKDLQIIFNTFIRLRDKDRPCISCYSPLVGKYDAGHFFSVGAYPNLRFNEDNVHGQCVHCNQHKHGNINEYRINLPTRIGQEAFDKLEANRNEPLKLSIPEIKELIAEYKEKIKSVKVS